MIGVLWIIVCILLVLGLAYWVTKYVVASGGSGLGRPGKKNKGLETLSQLALGREQRLVLVRAGNRYLLLGVTASQVTTLAELTEQEVEDWLSAPDTQERPAFGGLFAQGQGMERMKALFTRSPDHPSFGQALTDVIRQQKEKKGR